MQRNGEHRRRAGKVPPRATSFSRRCVRFSEAAFIGPDASSWPHPSSTSAVSPANPPYLATLAGHDVVYHVNPLLGMGVRAENRVGQRIALDLAVRVPLAVDTACGDRKS